MNFPPPSTVALAVVVYLTAMTSSRRDVIACPEKCICMNATQHVSCEGAALGVVPRDLPPTTATLDMSRNQLRQLAPGAVDHVRQLVELRLRENSIARIHIGAFEHQRSLQTLDVSGNNLTTLDRDAFRDAVRLLHLDLSNNQLVNVDGAFHRLKDLSRLDLRQNRLVAVGRSTFAGLANLRYLRLDDNLVADVDTGAFVGLERLMYFVLKGNPLGDHVGRFHFRSDFLSYVDLSECGLHRVPGGLPATVRYLQLRRNNLTVVERSSFRDCVNVSIVVLDENLLVDIEEGAFSELVGVQQIWLNGNRLRAIPRPLPATVQRLFVDANQLEGLEGAAADVFPVDSQLNTLSLMGNEIASVASDAFHRLRRLSSLDLSGNRLRRLHAGTFARSSELQTLTLSKNPLERLDAGCFDGLVELRTLSLSYISSPTVDVDAEAFRDLGNLRKLDVDSSPGLVRTLLAADAILDSLENVQDLSLLNADLETLRLDFPALFPLLAVVHISSARWHCDASIVWFRNWLLSAAVHIEGADANRCLTPRSVHDRLLTSLADSDFPSAPPTSSLTVVLGGSTTTVKQIDIVHRVVHSKGTPPVADEDDESSEDTSRSPTVRTPTGGDGGGLGGGVDSSPVPTQRPSSSAKVLTWEEILNRMSDLADMADDKNIELSPLVGGSNSKYDNDDVAGGRASASLTQHSSAAAVTSKSVVTSTSGRDDEVDVNSFPGDSTLIIVTATVLVTIVMASVMIGLIVYLCRKGHHPSLNGVKRPSQADRKSTRLNSSHRL